MPTKKLTQKPVKLRRRPARKAAPATAPSEDGEEEVLKTTLYLPSALFYRVAEAALRLRRTKTEVYEEAIREWLERHEGSRKRGNEG